MAVNTISIIELVVIATLLIIIVVYEIDRRRLKKEMGSIYTDMGFRISAHIEQTIKHANTLRYKLPNELYIKSPKKNAIVKEVCITFYEALKARLENFR